ncbi:MAG: pilin [Candidatus Berkelbacteria bacterium]
MNHIFDVFNLAHAATDTITVIDGNVRIGNILMQFINGAFILGGGVAVVYIILGGITYMTAGADEAKSTQAKGTVTNAVIGLILVAFSFTIVNWVSGSFSQLPQETNSNIASNTATPAIPSSATGTPTTNKNTNNSGTTNTPINLNINGQGATVSKNGASVKVTLNGGKALIKPASTNPIVVGWNVTKKWVKSWFK